ncbi:MAG: hypothetical protein IKG01_12295 [Lachnospiraceae bacterium]|nr:hypothetical protein [Lachnospiraceae bacterium]
MNLGTKIRTVLAIATSLNTALMATDLTGFNNGTVDAVYKIASIILNFIVVACVTYYNNDYTEIACEHTGEMRAKKAEAAGKVTGEYFYSDEEVEDESEDL